MRLADEDRGGGGHRQEGGEDGQPPGLVVDERGRDGPQRHADREVVTEPVDRVVPSPGHLDERPVGEVRGGRREEAAHEGGVDVDLGARHTERVCRAPRDGAQLALRRKIRK